MLRCVASDLQLSDYLQRILTARVYDVAEETPLDPVPSLSVRLANTVLLKREDTQPVFSLKLRGAYNKMVNLSAEERGRGVVCASAGNHAQGVAPSAGRLGCRATVVMPVTTPAVKVDAVRALGATIELYGDSYSDAAVRAAELQHEHGYTFVHPFDDPDVIAGQGTIARAGGADVRGHRVWGEHELRSAAIRCRTGRGARDPLRGDNS